MPAEHTKGFEDESLSSILCVGEKVDKEVDDEEEETDDDESDEKDEEE